MTKAFSHLPITAPLQLSSMGVNAEGLRTSNTLVSCVGRVIIPDDVVQTAEKIKFEHYKVNSPSKFKTHQLGDVQLMEQLSALVGVAKEKLNYVYFSACCGAEAHTDLLDPAKFTNDTYVIPVILPSGESTITVEHETIRVNKGNVYKFDHTKVHQFDLEDTSSGCVVIMVAVCK